MATTMGGHHKTSLGPSEDRCKRGTTPGMPPRAHFGLTGLATMGANLARNVAHHDIPVVVHNRTTSRMTTFVDEHGSEGPITGQESVADWVDALERPRVLMSMVQAGAATDAVIDEIAPHLDKGDVLIDGGNANFRDTQRRHAKLAEQGIHFLGVGVSGGEEGALNGPSIMPGGDREPLRRVRQGDLRGDRGAGRRDPVLHLRRRRRGRPLREDGSQRHRVRRHAADRRELRPAAPRVPGSRSPRSPSDSRPGTRPSSSRS